MHVMDVLDRYRSSSHLNKLLLEFVEFKLAKSDGRQGVQEKGQVLIATIEGRELGKVTGNYRKTNYYNRKIRGVFLPLLLKD
jgi:hypothetical protein